MTDEELIARLRDWQEHDEGKINDAREAAADRIEALLEQCEGLAQVVDYNWVKHQRVIAAEAKLAQAVEVLEALIHLAHDCEKELTEDLHHMDFCGESEPLTKARATLAEIKLQSSEFATQKGESHE